MQTLTLLVIGLVALAPRVLGSLSEQLASIVPQPEDDRFLDVKWRTNLMAARVESQRTGKPIFLWIMVGNPQGTT